ncbi:hypothetical protein Bca4012_025750 [Brassica carinata]
MVKTREDQDKSGLPLEDGCGDNPESQFRLNKESCEQEKGKVCGDDIAVENGVNKEGNAEEGCGFNTASDNVPQQICSEQVTGRLCLEKMAVDNGNNREANIVATSGAMEVDGGANMEDVSSEDEGDATDYDYNAWHDYVRNDCVTDDDDDFEEGPGKGKSGGQFGGNGNRRYGAISGRGVGSRKSASGRGQRSSAGGEKSNKNTSKRRL